MKTHFHNILKMMELYDKHGGNVSPFLGDLVCLWEAAKTGFFGSHVTPWIEPHAEGRKNC